MRRLRVLLLSLLLSACTAWGAGDIGMEAVYAGSMGVDWSQTVGITHRCAEINPFIGPCGDRVPPWIYFPASVALHVLAAGLLRGKYRTAFQGTTLGIELATIFWNRQL